tara:strand:- start:7042 stop:7416 length:375 start_codon:yes stop_codon:yes gene_type:complete
MLGSPAPCLDEERITTTRGVYGKSTHGMDVPPHASMKRGLRRLFLRAEEKAALVSPAPCLDEERITTNNYSTCPLHSRPGPAPCLDEERITTSKFAGVVMIEYLVPPHASMKRGLRLFSSFHPF